MKKVLVLTLRQGENYGGILQAYALKSFLNSIGYDADTTASRGPFVQHLVRSFPGTRALLAVLKGRRVNARIVTTKNTVKFIDKYLNVVRYDDALNLFRNKKYDAYISGSDQVWRSKYTYVPHNLFSGIPFSAIKISYAASFGKDDLDEYGARLIKKTEKLAKKMTAISVREDSGVKIAEKYWNVKASHHVDPTLLISREEYSALIDANKSISAPNSGLFSYVLDLRGDKKNIATIIARVKKIKIFTVINGEDNKGLPLPHVEQWLRSFRDAEYVVTDSFHGTVFSIIFNKPFIAIGNKERGLTRFTSLLNTLGLEDRLVTSVDEVSTELINADIDWVSVNAKIKSEQKRSLDYLKKHLG